MFYWELRRIFRQKKRSFTPLNTNLSYQTFRRRQIVISFVVFFIGWKVLGFTINETYFTKIDEKTGEKIYIPPQELIGLNEEKRRKADTRGQKLNFEKELLSSDTKFELDD